MSSHQEDIASKLLHSADARIAEAAKRVFSSALPAAAASLAALSVAAQSATAGRYEESPTPALRTDRDDRKHPTAGTIHNGGPDQTAAVGSGAVDFAATNDEVADDMEGSDKKPSSTERLKRR